MHSRLLGMLAETFIHPGTGQTDGAIDLCVAREAGTGYPFIPGSGMKGAFRDYARTFHDWRDDQDGEGEATGKSARAFGLADQAGQLIFNDARLLLLPVRALAATYKWIISPLVVERLLRDLDRAGISAPRLTVPSPEGTDPDQPPILTHEGDGKHLYLEERFFKRTGDVPPDLIALLQRLVADDRASERLARQVAMVTDGAFAELARSCLSIAARNKLNETTKGSEALWYEETLAPDTVMYTTIYERSARDAPLEALADLLEKRPYLQLGGNETTGQGWFKLKTIAALP